MHLFDSLENSFTNNITTYDNEKYKDLRNRFKIIQPEFYFDNEEMVFDSLMNWVVKSGNTDAKNNFGKFFHIEKGEPKHFHTLRPNITQDEIYKISQFYYPCTAQTVHFLQTNPFRNQLVLGAFDPMLWTLAMQPAGKQRIIFDFPK